MKQRIISAIVALIIAVPLVMLGGTYFAVGVGLIAVLAYKELLDLKENAHEIPFVIKAIGLINTLLFVYSSYFGYSIDLGLPYKYIAICLLTLLIPTLFYKDNKYTTKEAFYMVGVVLLLGIIFNAYIAIRSISIYLFVYLLLICVLTDTFAMLTGMLIGKHKIAPKISPKKTLEGCVGGSIISTTVVNILFVNTFNLKIVLATLTLSVIAQLGDLFFSKIKRENNIKDFSNIMPGHGGILDRLDSFSFVVISYLIFMLFI